MKEKCPKETTIQTFLLKQPDGKHTIVKHMSFPEKLKAQMFQKLAFGQPYKPQSMSANPKVGRKILQYCLENLGGRAFTCFDLTPQPARKGSSKSRPSLGG